MYLSINILPVLKISSSNTAVYIPKVTMGHASPMVTMRIYTAVLSEEIHEAGEILREKLSLDL
jgi:hypothetical protein